MIPPFGMKALQCARQSFDVGSFAVPDKRVIGQYG